MRGLLGGATVGATITALLCVGPGGQALAEGGLDPDFGDGGQVTTDFGESEVATAVATTPDGGYVVASRRQDCSGCLDIATVTRYTPNGDLVSSFGSDGLVEIGEHQYGVVDVTVGPNGRIIGIIHRWDDASGRWTIGVFRLLPNGAFDPAFGGGDGQVTTLVGQYSIGDAVAVLHDGRIVVAGTSSPHTWPRFNVTVVRYRPGGALDPTFGGDGIVTTDLGGRYDGADSIAIDAEGRVTISARADDSAQANEDDVAIVRYRRNGWLDTSFGGDGIVLGELNTLDACCDPKTDIAIDDARRIVVGAPSGSGVAVLRRMPGGAPDPTFGTDGKAMVPLDGVSADVVLQDDGRIAVSAGQDTRVPSAPDPEGPFAIGLLLPDGMLDTSFDGDGITFTPFAGYESASSVDLVARPGGFLAVGTARACCIPPENVVPTGDLALAAYVD